jgi:hypothetical protein
MKNELKNNKSGQESYRLLSSKTGQEKKSEIFSANLKRGQESYGLLSSKTGQEEMVGFGLILIIVAVVFLIFISASIRKSPEKTVDYQANSFIQAVLQYTTECKEENLKSLTVQKLIHRCLENNPCYVSNKDPCVVLNDTLKGNKAVKGIIKASWDTNEGSPVAGYFLIINISEGNTEKQFLKITDGVVTNNYRGSEQDLPEGGGEYISFLFNVYYSEDEG